MLPEALAAYEGVCLATVPDFRGYRSAASRAGLAVSGNTLQLPDGAARLELFATEQGCACQTTMIAPNPDATANRVIEMTTQKADTFTSHPSPEIAAVLAWGAGQNALQVEADNRLEVPLIRATLLSNTPCPQD